MLRCAAAFLRPTGSMARIVAAFAGVTVVTSLTMVPVGVRAQGSSKVPLRIQLTVGGQRFDYNGLGVCEWTRETFVYEVPASRWSVRHSESNRHFQLVVWRLRKGPADLLAMTVRLGARSHRVNTVRTKTRSEVLGSGRVAFVPHDEGGTFSVVATSDMGATISGTVACGAFVERLGRY